MRRAAVILCMAITLGLTLSCGKKANPTPLAPHLALSDSKGTSKADILHEGFSSGAHGVFVLHGSSATQAVSEETSSSMTETQAATLRQNAGV